MSATIAQSPRLLLTPRDAAAAMGISEKHLWNLTKAGAIKSIRLGRSVRYSVAALEESIARQQASNGNTGS